MFPFHSCSTISISGTTGSGKTTFVKKLIENLDTMFEPISPKKCYIVMVFIKMNLLSRKTAFRLCLFKEVYHPSPT